MGPWPSRDRVLIFMHKPPEPEFVGSKPIGPVTLVLKLDSPESEYMENNKSKRKSENIRTKTIIMLTHFFLLRCKIFFNYRLFGKPFGNKAIVILSQGEICLL